MKTFMQYGVYTPSRCYRGLYGVIQHKKTGKHFFVVQKMDLEDSLSVVKGLRELADKIEKHTKRFFEKKESSAK